MYFRGPLLRACKYTRYKESHRRKFLYFFLICKKTNNQEIKIFFFASYVLIEVFVKIQRDCFQNLSATVLKRLFISAYLHTPNYSTSKTADMPLRASVFVFPHLEGAVGGAYCFRSGLENAQFRFQNKIK